MNIEIIPAMDLIDGACVRLAQGDYDRRTTYGRDPLDTALRFEAAGLQRLHMVDLDGARAQRPANLKVLERIAARTRLEIQYGGGIKSRTALCDVFSAGARRAVCGSVAVREPDCLAAWLAEFGGERLILGADLRDGRIAIAGWSEETPLGAAELIGRFRKQGLQQVICTDIARDGMLCGPATSFYAALQAEFPDVEITVSGGIATLGDLTALDRAGSATSSSARRSTKDVSPPKISDDACQTNNPLPGHPRRPDGQGRQFHRPAQCGRSGGAGRPLRRRRCRRAGLPRHQRHAEGRRTFTGLVSRIAARIDIPFTVGGGIASVDDAGRLLDAGADKITVNSAAVADPSLIDAVAAKYGSQFVTVAIDARRIDGRWRVTTHGGRRLTDRELFAWAEEACRRGAGEILFTSMDHDGTRNGYPCDTFAQLSLLPVPVIASGGAGSVQHVADVLTLGRADAALAASIFHYGEIPIPVLKRELRARNIPVRL